MEPEEAAPADRHQRDLPPIVRTTPELRERDPYNRLLARGPRFRVDAEMVRDIALAASGLLNPKVGGPPIHPPLPAFLFQPPASYGPKVWPVETGPERYRRSLYIFRFRSVPHPMLQTFDAPNGDFACVRRSRSNTPLQALMTLNEPDFLECAGRWPCARSPTAARPTTTVSSTLSAAAWPAGRRPTNWPHCGAC